MSSVITGDRTARGVAEDQQLAAGRGKRLHRRNCARVCLLPVMQHAVLVQQHALQACARFARRQAACQVSSLWQCTAHLSLVTLFAPRSNASCSFATSALLGPSTLQHGCVRPAWPAECQAYYRHTLYRAGSAETPDSCGIGAGACSSSSSSDLRTSSIEPKALGVCTSACCCLRWRQGAVCT